MIRCQEQQTTRNGSSRTSSSKSKALSRRMSFQWIPVYVFGTLLAVATLDFMPISVSPAASSTNTSTVPSTPLSCVFFADAWVTTTNIVINSHNSNKKKKRLLESSLLRFSTGASPSLLWSKNDHNDSNHNDAETTTTITDRNKERRRNQHAFSSSSSFLIATTTTTTVTDSATECDTSKIGVANSDDVVSNHQSTQSMFFTTTVLVLGFLFSTVLSYPTPASAITPFVSSTSTPIVESAVSSSSSSSSLSSPSASALASTTSFEQNIMKSLKAPTDEQPQIPFPTSSTSTMQNNNSDNGSAATSSVFTKPSFETTNKKQQKKSSTVVVNEDQQYIVPIQIAIESSSPSSERPYNGADVLVLQVWTDRPTTLLSQPSSSSSSDLSSLLSSQQQGSTTTTTNAGAANKNLSLLPPSSGQIIGGAKIPIGAVVGGFPVRFSLGPLNSLMNGGEEQWRTYSSSKDLWLRASICRPSSDNDSNSNNDSTTTTYAMSKPSSSLSCPTPEFSTKTSPVLEGIGFSKWITLNTNSDDEGGVSSNSGITTTGVGGIRAPATVVLSTTTTTSITQVGQIK